MSNTDTQLSTTNILNRSYDTAFDVIVTEPVRRTEAGTALEHYRPATEARQNPTDSYKITDLDSGGATQYYGYTDVDGAWYIMQLTGTTGRYVKGTSGYTTAWTNRASQSYDYFYNIF